MSNLQPLKALKWKDEADRSEAQHEFFYYRVIPDHESYGKFAVRYKDSSRHPATGFATIEDAKAWAWDNYNKKMQPYVVPDSITDIANWFKAAKPEPTDKDRLTQIGCHYEEVSEMMVACQGDEYLGSKIMDNCARGYKNFLPELAIAAQPENHIELLDALCDQIVTATGVAYMMGFDIEGALKEVIRSNNSKMVKGKFQYDENGKMEKGESYSAPDLTPFVKQGE